MGSTPPVVSEMRSCASWCRILSIVCLVAAVGVAIIAPFFVQPTIHSCDVYIPNKATALQSSVGALRQFFALEGVPALFGLVKQFFVLETYGFSSPSFYNVSSIAGKRVLMVGGGYIKEFLYRANRAGVEVHLIDDIGLSDRVVNSVARFYGIENFGEVQALDPQSIEDLIVASGIKYDAVFTLVEDNGPLAARLANRFHLPGSPESAALTARNKVKVRQMMEKNGLAVPKYALLKELFTEDELRAAGEQVGYPCFLKPIYGVGEKVRTPAELITTFQRVQQEMNTTERPIYHFGKDMMLEGMMGGSEIQLEIMMHKGEMIYHCFSSQYSATREWLVFPSNLTQTQKDELLSLAVGTIKAIGLTDGVIHSEMFYSPTRGAQLIEINNRLSRGFLALQPSHQLFLGEKLADYWASVIYLALGEKPPVRDRAVPLVSVAVYPDAPSKTGWETDGPCAVFLGSSPAEALAHGQKYLTGKSD